ncbi:MAG: hypothetical protein AAAFM81_00080 [Pseudomonadota bacterium]
MRQRVIGLTGLIATAVIIIIAVRQSPNGASSEAPTPPADSPNSVALLAGDGDDSVPATSDLDDLESALAAAIEMREAAERKLEESERDVEALEAYLDEIEARGEDPVDYADEGIEKFQPAFFAWQDAMQEFEQAEIMEAEARRALAEWRERQGQ